MSRRKNHEEGHTVGLALFFLRRDAGMTLRQLSAATGSTPSSLSRYEKGYQMPRLDTLRRVVAGLGATMPDLVRTQQTVMHLPEEIASDEDGTLPPDTRTPQPQAGMSRQAALRLAHGPGYAVAHWRPPFIVIHAR